MSATLASPLLVPLGAVPRVPAGPPAGRHRVHLPARRGPSVVARAVAGAPGALGALGPLGAMSGGDGRRPQRLGSAQAS